MPAPLVDRRTLVASGIASGLAASLGAARPLRSQPSAAPLRAPPLTSDVGRLGRVLVHGIAETDSLHDRLSDELLPSAESDVAAAVRQQQALFALLREAGATPIDVRDALQAAIDATRPSGLFELWLRTSFPRLASDPKSVTADTILGRDPRTRAPLDAEGNHDHRADNTNSLMWTRDSAFMTPRGLVICRAVSSRRLRENHLLRFVYRYSPLLNDVPIAFDAVEEGLSIEGGDAQVVDANTLYLGTGNRTDPRIAPILARRLNMDILTVQTVKRDFIAPPSPTGFYSAPAFPLRILLLHLDTYFTHVAPNHVLAVPYLLEKAHAEDNPLARFIRGARAQTTLKEDEAEAGLAMLKDFGRVALFRAGTGKREDLGDRKLIDHLRDTRKPRITFVGGARPSNPTEAYHHFMTVSYPELRRQGTNVVQARPGRVIAYAGNPATRAALEADGVGVDTFEARELWAWHGGPHCLTQPLERS
jgi:N-dimethylarginine dimethylaminohydrolase